MPTLSDTLWKLPLDWEGRAIVEVVNFFLDKLFLILGLWVGECVAFLRK